MERAFGTYYPTDDIGARTLPDNTAYLEESNIFRCGSRRATMLAEEFRRRISSGERLYLVGFHGTSHNSGLSLVEASRHGVRPLGNYEEERFCGVKHFAGYPQRSAAELKALLSSLSLGPNDIFGVFYAFDVVNEENCGMRMLMVNGKIIKNPIYRFITESAAPSIELDTAEEVQMRRNIFAHAPALANVFKRLVTDLELPADTPCLQMPHHENHAYFAYGTSPFCLPEHSGSTTMIVCIDGGGDLSSISLFLAKHNRVELVKRNFRANSLGVYYMLCASMLGGWSALSAEGRYMGAAAWGNSDRLTNPFYKRLRQFFYFAADGEVYVNSAMTENGYEGLQEVVGPFVDLDQIWKPDAVLNVDDISHSPITRQRVDVAAAVQMVFEDAVFHIVGYLIEKTGSDQLVLCGGTALNCVANMRLLDHFDSAYYKTYFGIDTELSLWVPPIPSDQGAVVGAPYQFAFAHGAPPEGRLPTPFLCGMAPSSDDIRAAIDAVDHVICEPIGNINGRGALLDLAEWMAFVVAEDGVIGIFQGPAETGPRALGHRSILSNPANPEMLARLNSRVKLRERIRPLAPMVTLEEADKWFELAPGAAANDYDAYNYMVLTARARPCAKKMIPAVVHHDGTSRIQIVRAANNPLMYAYLKSLKNHIGAEVSVNTSLNVGSPIVQTPAQAVEIFKRSKGLDGIFMIGANGDAFMVWAKPGVQPFDSDLPRLAREFRRRQGNGRWSPTSTPGRELVLKETSTTDERQVEALSRSHT